MTRAGVKYAVLDTERVWTTKHYSRLSKVQIMGVGSDMIDRHDEGWTRWLGDEVFLPWINDYEQEATPSSSSTSSSTSSSESQS